MQWRRPMPFPSPMLAHRLREITRSAVSVRSKECGCDAFERDSPNGSRAWTSRFLTDDVGRYTVDSNNDIEEESCLAAGGLRAGKPLLAPQATGAVGGDRSSFAAAGRGRR